MCIFLYKGTEGKNRMQTRTIFYLRCAAYLRLLPRTRPQQNQLLAQTHSRRRAMLAPITKIALPSCIRFFPLSSNLHKIQVERS